MFALLRRQFREKYILVVRTKVNLVVLRISKLIGRISPRRQHAVYFGPQVLTYLCIQYTDCSTIRENEPEGATVRSRDGVGQADGGVLLR
jgi:hypothetical protein